MIYSSQDIECDRLNLDITGHFLPFSPLVPFKNRKIKILKKWKKLLEIIIMLHMWTKNHNHMRSASWDMECEGHNFLPFLAIFCHFPPLLFLKIRIWKNLKNTYRYYPFTHVNHEWRSYGVWFLRYKAWWTKFFVILGHFLPFDPPNNQKMQNFEKQWRN